MPSEVQIERVDVDVSSNNQTYTLSNDIGNSAKGFVRIMSATDKTSGGPTGSTGNSAPNSMSCGVEITGTDELTFRLPSTVSSRKMILEVWRFTGSAGSDYRFQTPERGSITITNGSDSASVLLSNISDRNNCVPMFNGYTSDETSVSDFEGQVFALHIDSSNNLIVSRNNLGTGVSCTIYYEVVEFVGSNWSVGHGVSTSHDSSAETVTLNTDSSGLGGSTFDVGDWENAMILSASMEGDSVETGLSDCIALVRPVVSTTQVEFSVTNADSNARNDGVGYVHVIVCSDMVVKRNEIASISEGNGSYGTALAMPTGVNGATPVSELGLEWFVSTNGTGTAHGRGRVHAKIVDNSGYEVQHWVHRRGNNVIVYYGVADFSSLETGGGPVDTPKYFLIT